MDTIMTLPDLSFYTPAELSALRSAVVAERLRRLTGQAITSGGQNGKNYGVHDMSDDALSALESALAAKLGTRTNRKRRICFN